MASHPAMAHALAAAHVSAVQETVFVPSVILAVQESSDAMGTKYPREKIKNKTFIIK